jgi:hypothetical protein
VVRLLIAYGVSKDALPCRSDPVADAPLAVLASSGPAVAVDSAPTGNPSPPKVESEGPRTSSALSAMQRGLFPMFWRSRDTTQSG